MACGRSHTESSLLIWVGCVAFYLAPTPIQYINIAKKVSFFSHNSHACYIIAFSNCSKNQLLTDSFTSFRSAL